MENSQRVKQIHGVAAALFSRDGYHGTTMRQIARELDLQGGSLYAHIAAKEDLLWGIVSEAAAQFLAALRPIAASDLGAADKLRAALRAHVGVVAANLDAATVYFHDWKYLGAERRAVVVAQRDEYEGLFRAIIAEGVANRVFRPDVDAAFAALLVLSVGNWLYQWYRPQGLLAPDDVADRFTDLALGGLLVESATSLNHSYGAYDFVAAISGEGEERWMSKRG